MVKTYLVYINMIYFDCIVGRNQPIKFVDIINFNAALNKFWVLAITLHQVNNCLLRKSTLCCKVDDMIIACSAQ